MPRAQAKKKPKTVARKKPAAKKKKQPMSMIGYEVIGLLLIGVAVLMAFQLGVIGKILLNTAELLTGYLAIFVPILLLLLAAHIMVKRHWPKPRMKIAASSVFLLTGILLICHLIWAAG